MNQKKDVPQFKKPYVTPVVSVFGNIRSITQTVGTRGALDNRNQKRTKA